ncbi:MAG TPA: hypothetical protein DIT03_07525, partial [Candidatus Accumulibacter sp.]|nr:hypothetical protein [Accumulibacter sp.]
MRLADARSPAVGAVASEAGARSHDHADEPCQPPGAVCVMRVVKRAPGSVSASKRVPPPCVTTIKSTIMPSHRYAPLLPALLLGACVSLPPEGPAVMALPGSGRSFEQFRFDDQICRAYAARWISPQTPEGAAVDSAVASAVLGTAVGAAVGAAVDGSS